MMLDKDTTIRVKQQTKDRLDEIGMRKETYNDIILRLLDFFNQHQP